MTTTVVEASPKPASLTPTQRASLFLIPPLAALGPWASFTPGAPQSPYFLRILLALMLVPALRGVIQHFPFMPPTLRRALLACGVFLCWGAIGLQWTPDQETGLRNLVSVSLGVATVIVMLGLSRGNANAVASLRWGFLAAVVCTGAVGIWEIRTGMHLREFDDGTYVFSPTSIASTFINPNNYGGFLLGALGPITIILTRLRSLISQGVVVTLLAVTFFLAASTESRGAVIGSLLIILIALIALAVFDLGYLITACILIAPAILAVPIFFSRQLAALIDSVTTQGDSRSDQLRVDLLNHAIRYFMESNWIGKGPGSFIAVLSDDPERTVAKITPAHNTFAQVAAEYGLIGLAALSLILLACLATTFPPSPVNRLRYIQFEVLLCFGALVGAAVIASSVLGDPSWWTLIGYMLCLSWMYHERSSNEHATQ